MPFFLAKYIDPKASREKTKTSASNIPFALLPKVEASFAHPRWKTGLTVQFFRYDVFNEKKKMFWSIASTGVVVGVAVVILVLALSIATGVLSVRLRSVKEESENEVSALQSQISALQTQLQQCEASSGTPLGPPSLKSSKGGVGGGWIGFIIIVAILLALGAARAAGLEWGGDWT